MATMFKVLWTILTVFWTLIATLSMLVVASRGDVIMPATAWWVFWMIWAFAPPAAVYFIGWVAGGILFGKRHD